ncbi:ubiquinone/menaquinone biosynthesis C-methylase UbiE [Chryseomicrobium aureum]|uniref:class I SAM-dependent methyltransferase n=1 Tax=Chryseomicrobium aureum TaxID=1441723 RepID=UPI00195C1BF3|nr:class I SAM-dependent methyltransferase [Chryseomicrobium aureum]MBM7706914.1 ubiquinone/menaquinone biosynthesis C-methylase UbiE [Chryseomicrobium aureum]
MLQNALNQSKIYLKEIIEPGDVVVDATAGNGHDTLFLAKLVTPSGKVVAFDIQQTAVESTKQRLSSAGVEHAEVILAGHERMEEFISQDVRAVVFNLGYLPGADHTVTTESSKTIQAIEAALRLLVVKGRIVLVIYHGHQTGKIERSAVLDFVATLPQEQYQVLHSAFLNQQNSPPELVVIERKN